MFSSFSCQGLINRAIDMAELFAQVPFNLPLRGTWSRGTMRMGGHGFPQSLMVCQESAVESLSSALRTLCPHYGPIVLTLKP